MLTLADSSNYAMFIPAMPFVAMLVCALAACVDNRTAKKLSAWVTIGAIGLGFIITCYIYATIGEIPKGENGLAFVPGPGFEWINVGDFTANFTFYIDALTLVMLMVVTGVGTLIAIYASGYMDGDPGYCRFFAYISLFIFAMTCLVMGDNLLLLYLGWEGVGAASYLLIGFYYKKPSAVAAAKKAFIVNRIGDFGFALGLMGIFVVFGSIEYADILPAAGGLLDGTAASGLEGDAADAYQSSLSSWQGGKPTLLLWAIPFLLMMGAFGKSAQLPLHVWLPDAMEGPTPVSALIHAATMVTAGVYMIARLINVFQLTPESLYVVAFVGACTALFAATIALCQNDLKRVWAYSTVSQLGYMFLGVGVMATYGAVFHLFTHAFFKALLFLTAGSVMHAMAGQLDMTKMSGLYRKMPVTAILMLIGCVALAGVPFTSGYYSKDEVLAAALLHAPTLGWIGIITALLTAFYTFRLWFRVFTGPLEYEMGNEHHGYPVESHGDDDGHGHDDHHHPTEPHEMPFWPYNAPLVLLAVGALVAGIFLGSGADADGHHKAGWMEQMVSSSTADVSVARRADAVDPDRLAELASHGGSAEATEHHDKQHDYEHALHALHKKVSLIAGGGALVMIALAWFFFGFARGASRMAAMIGKPVRVLLANKYYIDEIYDLLIRKPLLLLSWIAAQLDALLVDKLMIDGLIGTTPRGFGSMFRGMQRGALQGYALTMGFGLVVLVFLVVWWVNA